MLEFRFFMTRDEYERQKNRFRGVNLIQVTPDNILSPKALNHVYSYLDMVRLLTRLSLVYKDEDIFKGNVDMNVVGSPVSHEELMDYFDYTGSLDEELLRLDEYRKFAVKHKNHVLKNPLKKGNLRSFATLILPWGRLGELTKYVDVPETTMEKVLQNTDETSYDERYTGIRTDQKCKARIAEHRLRVDERFRADEKKYPSKQRVYFNINGVVGWEPLVKKVESVVVCKHCKKVVTVTKTEHYNTECMIPAKCGVLWKRRRMKVHTDKCDVCKSL
jgi:hypothetical protein